MKFVRRLKCGLLGLCLLWSPVQAEITLLGEAQLAGDSLDKSGLVGEFENGIPFNRFGGISAIEHMGGEEYLLLSDRGPNDGAVPYATRYHVATIQIQEGVTEIPITLTGTHLFTKKSGTRLIGASREFKKGKGRPSRFDPEGCRLIRRPGEESLLAISDEYGPRVDLFDLTGERVKQLKIPDKFRVAAPNGDPQAEDRDNSKGRQANGGFEGLGLSTDGKTLYAIMQKPLIQDCGLDDEKRVGQLNRILRIDLETAEAAEFVYPLDSVKTGVSEILWVGKQQALVLERDSSSGASAKNKKISRIDWAEATDVSTVDSLPSRPEDLSSQIKPVAKQPFLDLLDPRFGIAGENAPVKFEGLTFGPDLADGRKVLLVAVDNDFVGENPTRIFVFAITADEFAE